MLQYPHVFEDDVLENIKKWVMEEAGRISTEDLNWKNELGGRDVSDSEMLRTYSTGLLAICLVGYGCNSVCHSLSCTSSFCITCQCLFF